MYGQCSKYPYYLYYPGSNLDEDDIIMKSNQNSVKVRVMGRTIIQKIFDSHLEKVVEEGKVAIVNVDALMAQDGSAGIVIDMFNQLRVPLHDKNNNYFVIDHSTPSPLLGVSMIHNKIRHFAQAHQIKLFDVGCGICHQIMIESGIICPGGLIVGGESHSCMYGALNALGLGVGASDLAAVMATGKLWSFVPETLFVELRGSFSPGVSVRDLIFHLISIFKVDYAHLRDFAIEYGGTALEEFNMASRTAICNMANEMGGVTALMPFDKQTEYWTRKYVKTHFCPVDPDPDADYIEKLVVNLEEVKNMVAMPHSPDNIDYISKLKNVRVDQAIIGTCASGQIEDYESAAQILRGKKSLVRLLIVPSSRKILKELIRRGIIDIFLDAGATILPPGCGPCVGTHMGIVASGEVVISTSNRNYQGIMGSKDSSVYLASPETVAASAIAGKITKAIDVFEG